MRKAKYSFYFLLLIQMVFLRIDAFSQSQMVTNEIRTILEGDSTYLNNLFNKSPLYSNTELLVFYSDRAFEPGWSENQTLTCNALELRLLIQNAAFEGLVPEDYHLNAINPYFEKFFSGSPLTAHELAKVDFLLSDALSFMPIIFMGGKFIQSISMVLGKLCKKRASLRL